MSESRAVDPEATELLRRAIAASGLSARRFARAVLTRDERTVRRWLAGGSPIPALVLRKCEELVRAAHAA